MLFAALLYNEGKLQNKYINTNLSVTLSVSHSWLEI